MRVDYPKHFARSIPQPFGGVIGELIIDCNSTFEDFINEPRNYFAAGHFKNSPYWEKSVKIHDAYVYHYSMAELEKFWECIEIWKERTAANYLVHLGIAKALNPALRMLRGKGA